jgi:DNA-binding winged helix-turn-helix (wHTH) protein
LPYPLEVSGRLVTKDDFAAVWPNLAAAADTLVQSIVELRRALGNDGSRLLKTKSRRGYRLESRASAAGHRSLPIKQQFLRHPIKMSMRRAFLFSRGQ